MLHTWTRTLAYHPHAHGLLPAGGVSADRTQWQPAHRSYLVPVHALAQLLRGVFRVLVRQERPDVTTPESVWTRGWVVYSKPTMQAAEPVLQYLGPYLHRSALTNSRLLSLEDGQVCFRYQDAQDQRWSSCAAFCSMRCPRGSTTSGTMGGESHPSSPPAPTPAQAGRACP
ncbi:MAG TPA: transposase [Candidatus Tectomicrobia bacterium]|nr:transposase [Candidatus Tectomicrobia bacterium]